MKKTQAQLQTEGASPEKGKYAYLAAVASIVTALILIIVKTAAWLASGSASVLASLTDSISDAAISLMNLAAIFYSLRPADHEHRYGHGKIEGLVAIFQGSFICGAAAFLVLESLTRYAYQQPVENHFLGIGVMGFSILASLVLVAIQNHSLKFAPSLAVESEKAHYSADIFLNGGVIAVLAVLYYGGPVWVDPVFAFVVALYLVWTAKVISMKGMDMLLDHELPDKLRSEILNMVKLEEGVLGVHDLRTIKSGMRIFISFDIEVDPTLTLKGAHEIAKQAEKSLLGQYPDSEIMIHVDPYGDTEDSRHQVRGVHIE